MQLYQVYLIYLFFNIIYHVKALLMIPSLQHNPTKIKLIFTKDQLYQIFNKLNNNELNNYTNTLIANNLYSLYDIIEYTKNINILENYHIIDSLNNDLYQVKNLITTLFINNNKDDKNDNNNNNNNINHNNNNNNKSYILQRMEAQIKVLKFLSYCNIHDDYLNIQALIKIFQLTDEMNIAINNANELTENGTIKLSRYELIEYFVETSLTEQDGLEYINLLLKNAKETYHINNHLDIKWNKIQLNIKEKSLLKLIQKLFHIKFKKNITILDIDDIEKIFQFFNDYTNIKYRATLICTNDLKCHIYFLIKFIYLLNKSNFLTDNQYYNQLNEQIINYLEHNKLSNIIYIDNKTGEKIIRSSTTKHIYSYNITDIKQSEIYILENCNTIEIENCIDSNIVIGPTNNNIIIKDCYDCKFSIICNHLKIYHSQHCKIYLHCIKPSLLYNSINIIFNSYNIKYSLLSQHMDQSNINKNINLYHKIIDHNPNLNQLISPPQQEDDNQKNNDHYQIKNIKKKKKKKKLCY